MKTYGQFTGLILIGAALLSACGGVATPEAMQEEAMMDQTATPEAMPEAMEANEAEMMAQTATAEAMLAHETPMAETAEMDEMAMPAWFEASLTEAASGQVFKIGDFKDKVVLVETMAIWCPTCLSQQVEIQKLHDLVGVREDFVSVSLDIDSNEDLADLQSYLADNSFGWRYAVAPAEVSREIASLYGDQFLNPPSTPILVIDRHGAAHPLPFGLKSAEDLLQMVQPYLDESM